MEGKGEGVGQGRGRVCVTTRPKKIEKKKMWDVLFTFLYGWMLGSVAVVLCYLCGLEDPTRLLHLINRVLMCLYARLSGHAVDAGGGAACHESLLSAHCLSTMDPVESQRSAPAPAGLSSVRHASMCQVSWCAEAGALGAARECRLVLFDTHLVLNEVKASQNVGTHERVVTNERPCWRVRVDTISAQPHFLQRGRRRSASFGSVCGHVLLISSSDSSSFFAGGESLLDDPHLGSSFNAPSVVSVQGAASLRRRQSRSIFEKVTGGGLQKKHGDRSNSDLSNEANSGVGGSVAGTGKEVGTSVPSESRRSIAVKFYSAREQERWLNLLKGPQEAANWRAYLQTLTTPDVFNLFLTRLLVQSMRTTALANFIRATIQKKLDILSVTKFPRDVEGRILLEDFILGNEVPIFSNVSPPNLLARGEMIFDFDLLYRGGAMLCLRLNLTYRGIRIPHVVLSIKILHFFARFRVSVGPPPSKKFWVGSLTPPDLRVKMHQGIATRKGILHRILTSLPDFSPIATNLIKLYLLKEMVLPMMDDFSLPNVEKDPPMPVHATTRKTWAEHVDRLGVTAPSKDHHTEKAPGLPSTRPAEGGGGGSRRSSPTRLDVETNSDGRAFFHAFQVLEGAEFGHKEGNDGSVVSSAQTAGVMPVAESDRTGDVGDAVSDRHTPPIGMVVTRGELKARAQRIMRQAVRCVGSVLGDVGETHSARK